MKTPLVPVNRFSRLKVLFWGVKEKFFMLLFYASYRTILILSEKFMIFLLELAVGLLIC